MKQKQYKCGYRHCSHVGGIVLEDDSVKVKTRRWHKDCYELQSLIVEIEENYVQNISKSVPITYLRKIINDIVFGKKLENPQIEKWQSNLEAGKYLNFCLEYAIEKGIKLTHPPGLYYLIDNAKIKNAYQKEKELQIQKQIRDEIKKEENNVAVPISTEPNGTATYKNTTGFGSILKGGK